MLCCLSNLLFTALLSALVLLLCSDVTCYSEIVDANHYSGIREIFDLGYTQDESTLFFPGQRFTNFELYKDIQGFNFSSPEHQKYFFAMYSFCQGEHGGTHVDAPFHFNENGWKVGEIPQSRLVDVPAVVVDVMEDVFSMENPGEFELQIEHLMRHERQFGPIPPNAVILLRTGWSRFWPNFDEYFGTANGGMSAPGYSAAAAKWLRDSRSIVAAGIDTASIDNIGTTEGGQGNLHSHIILAAKQVYLIENVANLDYLLEKVRPPRHSSIGNHRPTTSKCDLRVIVLPIKSLGTGGPARIMAYCKPIL